MPVAMAQAQSGPPIPTRACDAHVPANQNGTGPSQCSYPGLNLSLEFPATPQMAQLGPGADQSLVQFQAELTPDRRKATEDVLRALAPFERDSAEARRIAAILRLMLDRDRIQREARLAPALNELQTGPRPARLRSLQALSNEVVDRARHFTLMMAAGEYSSEDAARLLNIAKYSAQLLDDLRDPGGSVSGDNQSKPAKFLATAYGVAAVLEGTLAGDARTLVDGLRDLTANSSRLAGSIGPVIDIPAETVGAIVNVSRKGMITASNAIDDIKAAMAGDNAAVERAIAHARELQATLSGESYGMAMKEAMQSRLVDKVPGLRTVLNLWPEDGLPSTVTPDRPKSKEVGFRWHWSARHPSVNDHDIIVCGPSPDRSTKGVYGTNEYADDSLLCLAAVHAGAIGWKGGRIRVTFIGSPGTPLVGSVQHGIESGDFGKWRRRFTVAPIDVTR